MASFTIAPLSEYLPKMGKKAQSLLTVDISADDAPEAVQLQAVRVAWRKSVETAVRTALGAAIDKQLAEIVEEHEMFHGARPDKDHFTGHTPEEAAAEAASWDSDLDDAISSSFDDKFWHAVGPSGMVELTTDTVAHDNARRTNLAWGLVDQVVANGTWFALNDDEARLILKAAPPQTMPREVAPKPSEVFVEDTPPSFEACWSSGLRMVRAAFTAQTHDALSIYDELDGVIDSDDILSGAAASRLAPHSEPAMVRTIFQVISSRPQTDGWIDHLVMAALDAETPEETQMARDLAVYDAKPLPAKVEAAAADMLEAAESPVAKTRRSPAEQNEADERATEIMCEFVKLSGMTEQTMADILGVSRAMVNAALKRKKNVDWTPERVARLHQASMDFTTDAATFHETARSLAA